VNAAEAISAVAEHARSAGIDYPTGGLVADRADDGWFVYAATKVEVNSPEGLLSSHADRATFLVSDSGNVEQVSRSSSPATQPQTTEPERPVAGASSLSADSGYMADFGRASEAAAPAAVSSLDVIGEPADPDGNDGNGDDGAAERASVMVDPVAQQLASLGPDEWDWLRAEFAFTVSAEIADVTFETTDGWQVQLADVPEDIMTLLREQRDVSAEMAAGPWWRLLLEVSNQGEMAITYDYGDDPFPQAQLQPVQNYIDDMAAYPRPSLPVWLAAYLAGPGVQGRDVPTAEAAASADRLTGRVATHVDDVEPLEDIWARWAVLAALHSGVQSEEGPRIAPGLGWYESDTRSGATLVLLSGDRAVLSGGWWDSPLLATAYHEDEPLPDLFAGAPVWVNDAVLNIRCQHGLLSFCYWWTDGRWWRGATDTAAELDMALPPVWTIEETVAEMTEIIESAAESACQSLLTAVMEGAGTVEQVIDVFASEPEADVNAALNQLAAAGLIQ
jgi:hypothetical protein